MPDVSYDDAFKTIVSNSTVEFVARYGLKDADVIVTNKNIISAAADSIKYSNGNKGNAVNLEFDKKGSELFETATENILVSQFP